MKVLIVTNMYPTSEQPAFGTFVEDQVAALRRVGVTMDVLFINGRKGKLHYLWGVLQLWQRLLKERYDLIHAHYVFSGVIARLQFLRPVVVTYHGSELGVHPNSWLGRLSRTIYPLFNRLIVVSPWMKLSLNNPTNVRVIPCGINFEEMKPISKAEARQILGLPHDKPLVVWAGEPWRSEKRYSMIEQAVDLVRKDIPDAELILVSGRSHAVIPVYLSSCDVLALTSSYEGSPMLIKEAMACNLPIVSVDVGDVAEVIGGTEGCYLVDPTPQAVADKLRLLLSHPHRTNGRTHVAHLRSEVIAGQIIEVYRELIGS
jgi:glycosyltransferase involved in cell wall biosynthesis